jgi:hypothetical protein
LASRSRQKFWAHGRSSEAHFGLTKVGPTSINNSHGCMHGGSDCGDQGAMNGSDRFKLALRPLIEVVLLQQASTGPAL